MKQFITAMIIALSVIKVFYCDTISTKSTTNIVNINHTPPLNYLETDWPPICVNGLNQSPIDISDKFTNNIITTNSSLIAINSSNYTIIKGINFKIVNNEKFTLNMAGMGNIIVIKNGITYLYDILDIHIHILSEHTINGTQYDLEMHMVHSKKTTYLNNTGITQDPDPNQLLVVALLFKITSNAVNPDIYKMNFGTLNNVIGLDMNPYVNPNKNFFHYSGSLTSPGCMETVNWVVMENIETIGVIQYQDLKNLILPLYPQGNERMTKPLNGRTVYYVQNSCSRYLQSTLIIPFIFTIFIKNFSI